MERMPIWQIALRRLEMPVPRFLTLYVAPIVAATFLHCHCLGLSHRWFG